MKKQIQLFLIVISLFFITGCSATLSTHELSSSKKESYKFCPYKVDIQESKFSCGAAVVSSFINYWGEESKEKEILSNFPPKSELGYSVGELKSILEEKGFITFVKSGKIKDIEYEIDNGRPVILPLSIPRKVLFTSFYSTDFTISQVLYRKFLEKAGTYNHFVAVIGYDDITGNYLIADPSHGIETVSEKRLIKAWNSLNNIMIIGANPNFANTLN